MRISDLFIYPVKSARGIALQASAVDAFGLVGDRRAMVVAPDGKAITQRELPLLARITVEISSGSLLLRMEGKSDIVVQRPSPVARLDVDIWKSIVSAAVADEATNRALSGWLGREVQLAIFDDASERLAEEAWVGSAAPVTFADGFQILVTTTGSLSALNEDLATHGSSPVGMDRFRPNIVIDCPEPWQEDRWAAIEINGIRMDLVKPCARCIMTTQDQLTGSRDVANPMPSMGRLRMSADRRVPGPLFGWNTVPRGEGMIEVGNLVKIIEERSEGWAFKRR
ncbi:MULTISPECIES: MOSC domain-containing protein [unclassified Rhizobium]|uniref:MOSC domain-containing protein n=2 Tax=Rhizobium TaxID=379 RepID=UPI001ADC225A|nr:MULTISPECIES: MOSC domain-containing protein [unclassified Rhizobium]MBO9097908.1 MOSC domain-containing protein [Rhizobium sp. L58/93]MBO9133309.1 MOSC domain-containing protein [Rhizobium sp. B209b/85]MBO9168059.1 MOSC domain-containing protein [Rhizobium sp. L245/93]MBO9184104.1 MOSC domain-containing protein [Rhizobium sp. E27B/91]QXZ84320.1 MOSC domain-containing protein [Rhizobium sp. K1/93]